MTNEVTTAGLVPRPLLPSSSIGEGLGDLVMYSDVS